MSKKNSAASKSDIHEVDNYYKLWGSQVKRVEDPYQLVHPSNILATGMTNSGKTNIIPNLIKQMGGFDRVIVFNGQSVNEFIYDKMKEQIGDCFEGYSGFGNFQTLIDEIKNDIDLKNEKIMFIVDDFLNAGKIMLDKLAGFSTWCRKLTDGGLTFVVLTQSFFDVPKKLRQNVHYFLMMRGHDKKEIRAICSRFSCKDCDIDDLFDMYEEATEGGECTDFFIIDKKTMCNNLKCRRQFKDLFIIAPDEPYDKDGLLALINKNC